MSLTSRRTVMARKRYKPEETVAKLRQVDVLVSQRQPMADAIRQIGVSEVTYYRWRQEFGGLKTEQVKRLKDLELENSRLRKAVSDLTLDKLIPQEAAPGKLLSLARRRACIEQVRAQLHVSERRACAALGQHRSTQRKVPRGRDDERRLTADIIELARQYGRYGGVRQWRRDEGGDQLDQVDRVRARGRSHLRRHGGQGHGLRRVRELLRRQGRPRAHQPACAAPSAEGHRCRQGRRQGQGKASRLRRARQDAPFHGSRQRPLEAAFFISGRVSITRYNHPLTNATISCMACSILVIIGERYG